MKNQLGRIFQTRKNPVLHFPGLNYLNLKNEKCSRWVATSRNSTAAACHSCELVHLELQGGFHDKCAWDEMTSEVHCIPGASSLWCDHVVDDAVAH